MTKPNFPYGGNQVMVTSDRVIVHSREDAVFLLGKTTVGVSTPGTFNVDAGEKAILFSPRVQLGRYSTQRILLGETTIRNLTSILSSLKSLCDTLANINESNFAANIPQIRNRASILSDIINDKLISIDENLSKVTYSE